MSLTTLNWIILMAVINGLLAFAGAFLYLILKNNLNKVLIFLVAFTTGALLGGAFFHFIPEAIKKISLTAVIAISLIGFVSFYSLEKILHWHHCHEEKDECKHSFTYLILCGDSIHNFIDGLIIASSFIISIPIGLLTSFLILVHELPQEIGDFGLLVYGGFSEGKALFYNFLSQSTALLGGILGFYFLSFSEELAVFLLPFTAGGFIYIAVMDLIPEVFKEKNNIKILANLTAIALGLLILISSKFLVG